MAKTRNRKNIRSVNKTRSKRRTSKKRRISKKRQRGGNSNSLSQKYDIQLYDGIEEFNKNKIIRALENGANVNTKIRTKTPPLVRAVLHGDLEIVKLLLEHPDIDVNAQQGEDGATALIKALRALKYVSRYENTIEIIKLLLKDKRTNVSIDTVYSTALVAAGHNNAPQDIIDLIREREREEREREERKQNIAMSTEIGRKGKTVDGKDLVPVAKRDVSTMISRFF